MHAVYCHMHLLQIRLVRKVLDIARLQPGDRVLDVACGRGKSSHMASYRVGASGRVLGLDLLPQVGWLWRPAAWQLQSSCVHAGVVRGATHTH